MAVTKTEVLVNSGNTGWTQRNVIDALETTFSNLGWHGGTAKAGVPVAILPPGSTQVAGEYSSTTNWTYTSQPVEYGGDGWSRIDFIITNNGSTNYTIKKRHLVNYVYSNDTITISYNSRLSTGDPIVYEVPAGNEIVTSTGTLTSGTTYYAIRVDAQTIKLALTASDATNGIAIDITQQRNNVVGEYFYEELGSNPTLEIYQGDDVDFIIAATGHPFYITDQGGTYNSNRVINTTNYASLSGRSFPTAQGIENGQIDWSCEGWRAQDYYYVCQTHPATMTGTIRVLPSTYQYYEGGEDGFPHWDYSVPASGSRGQLDLRVYRNNRRYGNTHEVRRIEILNEPTGWTDGEVFTIPGDQIGGSTPTNDITFGVNSATSNEQQNRTAVPSVRVVDVGAGTTFFQKGGGVNGNTAILKLENDAAKTYGTTYWAFLVNSNMYRLEVRSGSEWNYRNWDPTSSTYSKRGRFGGVVGLDKSYAINTGIFQQEDNEYNNTIINFATSSGPTNYPLKIVTHAANSPQDTNFVLISFVQTIDGTDTVFDTIFLHKGTNFGSGIWDLDHVWQGSCTKIYNDGESSTPGINFDTKGPAGQHTAQENTINDISPYSVKREAMYGFHREGSDGYGFIRMNIENNINTDNNHYSSQSVIGYYRNSTYDLAINTDQNSTELNKNDVPSSNAVSSSVDFNKPIKGIPLSHNLMPCPYYLPDDFTIIQFEVSPGATTFNYGDTITVSGSEVYEIVQTQYSTNQTGLDGVSGNTSKGIAFCARTT